MPRKTFCAAAALALVGAACAPQGAVPTPPTGTTTSAAVSTATTASPGHPARLLHVVDGDTLAAALAGAEEEVRLLGVNAPEAGECFGREAAEFLRATLGSASDLRLDAAGGRDQFGRLLAYAYADGALVNLALVEAGYALALDTDHPRRAEFLAAEEAAYAARRGLWAPGACGPPAAGSPGIVDLAADPPGPDEQDLNGEWVLVSGDGVATVDLTGWVLRDESSQNRYHFPEGFRLRPGEAVAVFTGCGQDGPETLYWCAGSPVWNNQGDAALLLDASGNVVSRLRYGG